MRKRIITMMLSLVITGAVAVLGFAPAMTTKAAENGWADEGVAWTAPAEGTPVDTNVSVADPTIYDGLYAIIEGGEDVGHVEIKYNGTDFDIKHFVWRIYTIEGKGTLNADGTITFTAKRYRDSFEGILTFKDNYQTLDLNYSKVARNGYVQKNYSNFKKR